MSEPIISMELQACAWERIPKPYTYEELLEIFDEGSVVHPLVQRCIKYEKEIDMLLDKNKQLHNDKAQQREYIRQLQEQNAIFQTRIANLLGTEDQ